MPNPLLGFALCTGTLSGPRVCLFEPSTLDDTLAYCTQRYLETNMVLDIIGHKIYLPKMLQWYKGDFDEGAGSNRVTMVTPPSLHSFIHFLK